LLNLFGCGSAALGNVGDVTSPLCRESDVLKVITLIAAQMLLDVRRRGPGDDERVQRRPKTLLIMDVGSRECDPKRDSLAIDNEVTFRAELASIGRVLARFIPPFTGAETVTLSSDCHFQSMPLQRSYSSKQSFQSWEKIPALVHFWKCSWAAEPEPYSRGNIFHWHPVLRTYRIPLKIVRWGVGGRPPWGERTCLGKRGSTLAQTSSETSRQPGLRGNGFRDLEFRAMAGSSNKMVKIIHLHYNITNQDLLVFEFMDALLVPHSHLPPASTGSASRSAATRLASGRENPVVGRGLGPADSAMRQPSGRGIS